MTDDQERLVAEALRAQAARTPLPEPEHVDATADPVEAGPVAAGTARPADPPTVQRPRYPAVHPAAMPIMPIAPPAAPPERTDRLEPAGVAVGWVVLLAVLLGLASGAVVGLLTLL